MLTSFTTTHQDTCTKQTNTRSVITAKRSSSGHFLPFPVRFMSTFFLSPVCQTLSLGQQRCGRPVRPCRTSTRRCSSQTWSTLWTRRWSRTCKLLLTDGRTSQVLVMSWQSSQCLLRVPTGGTMLSRTRSPRCRVRPRTEPTPTAARSRPTCHSFWRLPVVSTHR